MDSSAISYLKIPPEDTLQGSLTLEQDLTSVVHFLVCVSFIKNGLICTVPIPIIDPSVYLYKCLRTAQLKRFKCLLLMLSQG